MVPIKTKIAGIISPPDTKTVFLSTSALVNMASDGGDGQQVSGQQGIKICVCLPLSFIPIFVLAFSLILVGLEYGVGPLFMSKLTLYIISLT